jgi:NAD(P)-dependent dehydrogenase (short-subunit alcohol dehydrogenase family)
MNIFITGAGRGLGAALAMALAERGERVFAGLQAGGAAPGPGIEALPLDVSDIDSIRSCARAVEARAGSLDWLINNAAILGPMDDAGDPELDYLSMAQVFDVNALGALRACHEFWPLLEKGREKMIVNIGSEAGSIGECGRSGWFGYGMSKAALNMASAQFHNFVRPRGGRVMVLHPGWVRSWMKGHLDADAPLEPRESADALLGLIARRGAEVRERPLYLQWDGRELPW